MLAYATVGTNDMEKAGAFYDAILSELGGSRFMENERLIAWSAGDGAGFGVIKPYDENPATISNGGMLSFACSSTDQVDSLYAKVLEMGGTDEGAPGERMEGMYMAYWRDLDGNKMNFLHRA